MRRAPENAPSGPSGTGAGRPRRDGGRRGQVGFIRGLIDQWWNRLIGAVYHGTPRDLEAQYLEHETGQDYIWNTVGTAVWGMVFPILTIVCTQLAGTEQAGMFSMAFVTGTLLMIVSNFGVRTYQASDIDEHASFLSYQVHRALTSVLALVAGIVYCSARGYDAGMTTLCMGVYIYKVVDGLADVYEGRLQQADKLYLAGISQTIRSAAVLVVFSMLLLITRSMQVAAIGMAVAAVASLVLVSLPLAYLETDRSAPVRPAQIGGLFRHCLPLFGALFLFNLIESMPKFSMESMLPYSSQLYFNALFFPAQGILLATGFIYKPQLLRLASIWANPRRRKRFDLIVFAMVGIIVGITLACSAFMAWAGIGLMSLMYGVDFEGYRVMAQVMIVAGGTTAAIDFLYAVITVLRRQAIVMRAYLIATAASLVVPPLAVRLFGIMGAAVSYLAVMVLLLALLIMGYIEIRRIVSRERNPFQPTR